VSCGFYIDSSSHGESKHSAGEFISCHMKAAGKDTIRAVM